MPLHLPDGTSCFLDANIFYYHFVETPPFSQPCSDLLERIADGAIQAFTSVHLLAEAMHTIMLAEAAARFALTRASLVNWLQAHRHRITELDEFRQALKEMSVLPAACFSPDLPALSLAADIAKEVSLLTNDALSIALMRQHGLTHLVTNDDDFDAVTNITVWKPR